MRTRTRASRMFVLAFELAGFLISMATTPLLANTVTFYSGPGDHNNSGLATVQTGPSPLGGGFTETVPGIEALCGGPCENGEVLTFEVLPGLVSAEVQTIADQGTAVMVNYTWLQEFNVGSGVTDFTNIDPNVFHVGTDNTLAWFNFGGGPRAASVKLTYGRDTVSQAPEPATFAMFGAGGLLVLLGARRRKQTN